MVGILDALVLSLLGAPASCETYPGVVRFPINRLKPDSLYQRDTASQGVVEANIENLRSYYGFQCALGTPPQNLDLLIDTGSSDFWVMSPETSLCQQGQCKEGSQFDSSNSSTYRSNSTAFYQQYGDGSSANGTWAQDVLAFGGASIKNFNFALANVSTSDQPVAGIGLAQGETPYILGSIDAPYANLPLQLKSNGLISHVAYSLYLDATSDAEGSILFGGVNTGAYNGTIYTHPMVPVDTDNIDRLAINLQGIYVMNNKGDQQQLASLSLPIVLDSGSTVSMLPDEILSPLMDGMGATYYAEVNQYLMKCDQLSSNHGGIGLVFSNVEYVINFRDVMVETRAGYCDPGFLPGSSIAVLGDNILRTLYVVYDLENLEIGIAQANTAFSTSYLAISGSIPGQKAPGYSNTGSSSFYDVSPVTILGYKPTSTSQGFGAGNGGFSASDGVVPTASGSQTLSSEAGSSVQVSITVGGLAASNGMASVHVASGASSGSASQNSGSSASSTSGKKSGKSSNAAPAPNMVFAGGAIFGIFNLIMLLI